MEIVTSCPAFCKGVKSSLITTWTITAIDCEEGKRTISSSAFPLLHPDEISSTSWSVSLSLRLNKHDTKVAIAAFLRNESGPSQCFAGQGLRCTFGIYCCLQDDSSFHGFRGTRTFMAPGSRHGWEEVITMNDLRRKGLTANKSLRVRTELAIFADTLQYSVNSNACTSASD